MLALLASTITLSDPAGDARGDGGYVLPTRPAFTPDMLDLRAFSAQPQGEGMRFTVSFTAMGNPWNAPSGSSAGVTDIFVKGSLGASSCWPIQACGCAARAGGPTTCACRGRGLAGAGRQPGRADPPAHAAGAGVWHQPDH
ncbi:glucodextranase DOMON-like domain-containing protein [Deinococcus multiflagellatus]|uniref:Glucodextranase DOMON-like domain-containing protein n=1 Tax=Deinococcus multiflagellatus TaxID=1656887 RepID=A0ABW1ZH93_9DEIO